MFVLHAADGPLHLDPIALLQVLQITRHGAFTGSGVHTEKNDAGSVIEANGSVTSNLPFAANERAQLT